MSPQPVHIQITDGPSADKVLDAVKYAYDKTVTMKPWFEILLDAKTPAPYTSSKPERTRILADKIVGISYESGAPGMFILTMYALDGTYEAFYNASTRKGAMHKKS